MPKRLIVLAGNAPEPREPFLQRDLDALRRRGWQIDVFGLDGRGPAISVPVARDALLAVLRQGLRHAVARPRQAVAVWRRAGLVARVAAHARAVDADLLLAHFAWITADVAAAASAITRLPFACAVHGWDVFAQAPGALRPRLAGAARILACSEAAAHAVRRAGVGTARVARVRHGLPLDVYSFNPTPRPPGTVMAVGRLERKKGFDVLISACARLVAAVPDLRLELVGDGSQRDTLQRQIAREGLRDRVILHGALPSDAVRARMARVVALVLPSRSLPNGDRDGIANVMLEAMALGTPVVTTPAGAANEIIRDDANGLLVPPDAPDALAAALAGLLTDAHRRARLAAAARADIERDFDISRTAAALDEELAATQGQ